MANATRLADTPRGNPFVGSYTGTTAAQNIHIGFKPAFIMAWNFTDGDKLFIWTKHSATTITSIDTEVANETVAITAVDNGTVLGFSLPSDSTVNEDAKVYVFIAFPE